MLAVGGAELASAGVISSVTGGLGGRAGNQLASVTWTQTETYTNVEISAIFYSLPQTLSSGTFYLTTKLGPGTTVADEIARLQLVNVANAASPQLEGLFGGLTLGPGTYYLTLADDLPGNWLSWIYVNSGETPLQQTGLGVTQSTPQFGAVVDPTYAPGGVVFNGSVSLIYSVTGDLVTPEPATAGLVGAAMLAALVAARRKLRLS